MRVAIRVFIALVLLVGLERLIRTQTRGFRIDKTIAEYPYNPAWSIDAPVPKELNQKFYFLGSGAQTYSFISEDQTTVLKLFKHYHCWPSSRILKKLPGSWKALPKREQRMKSIFESVLLAYKKLPEETQIFHLSLNPQEKHYPSIILFDKIGIRYIVDLNQPPSCCKRKPSYSTPIWSSIPMRPKQSSTHFSLAYGPECAKELPTLTIMWAAILACAMEKWSNSTSAPIFSASRRSKTRSN